MTRRIANVGIIVEDRESVSPLNEILHDYAPYIAGRMGVPYRDLGISVISIVMDAPQDIINALSGKIGRLPGVSAKTAYSNFEYDDEPDQEEV